MGRYPGAKQQVPASVIHPQQPFCSKIKVMSYREFTKAISRCICVPEVAE